MANMDHRQSNLGEEWEKGLFALKRETFDPIFNNVRKEVDAERKEGSRFEVEYPASTRVAAYKYVPDNEDEFDSGVGNLCVRFIKQGNRRREYVYPNVPYHTYLNFHSPGTSKGKFINSTLNGIGYHEAKDKDMQYFTDF